MTKQLLFYESCIPVTPERHQDCTVDIGSDYSFARDTNAVLITCLEFTRIAREYPVVFAAADAQKESVPMPVAVIGLNENKNLCVNAEGHWKARYVPASVRQYPFIFSRMDDAQSLVLCVDESFKGFNRDGRGKKLFDENGKQSGYLQDITGFLGGFQSEYQRTQKLCELLHSLGLFEEMEARIALPSGRKIAMQGFLTVDRNKLEALPQEKLGELARIGYLELVYLHFQSLDNFDLLVERLGNKTE